MWHTARSPEMNDLLKEIDEQKDCRLTTYTAFNPPPAPGEPRDADQPLVKTIGPEEIIAEKTTSRFHPQTRDLNVI